MRNGIDQGYTEGFSYILYSIIKPESDNCKLRFAYLGCRVQRYLNIFQIFEIFLNMQNNFLFT